MCLAKRVCLFVLVCKCTGLFTDSVVMISVVMWLYIRSESYSFVVCFYFGDYVQSVSC